MLLDELQPQYDATRIEHRVIAGQVPAIYDAVTRTDFMREWRDSTTLKLLFAARTTAERALAAVRSRPYVEPPPPSTMRLADMPTHGDWVRLGEAPPQEVAFGVVGRFWSGETRWEQIDAAEFASFARPGLAKIACNFSLRAYGASRTLVSYEAHAGDRRRSTARVPALLERGLARVGVVMRAQLKSVERQAG